MKPVIINTVMDVGIPHQIKLSKRYRRCVKCKKSLSMYNRMNECFSHVVDENTDIPKTIRRTSLKKRIDEEEKIFQWMQTY